MEEKPKTPDTPLPDARDLAAAKTWLERERTRMPEGVFRVFETLLGLLGAMTTLSRRYKTVRQLLLQSWRLEPTSEKVTARKPGKAEKGAGKARHKSALTKPTKRKKTERLPGTEPHEGNHPKTQPVETPAVGRDESPNLEKAFASEELAMSEHFTREWKSEEFLELKIGWTRRTQRCETVTHVPTGKKAVGAPDDVFPGGKYTFETIANLIILHVGHQMPLTRLAALLSTPKIPLGKSTIFGLLVQAARVFLPIFHVLVRELFTHTSVLEMDDFNPRVNHKGLERARQKTAAALTDAEKIMLAVDAEEGLSSTSLKTKDQKPKTKVNLTVFSGLMEATNAWSRVVVKLSHLGSAGDLAGRLLAKFRDPKKPLWIVSDLGSGNTLREAGLEKHIIHRQACIWHARRRFWRARDYDDECWHALRCFHSLALIEKRIQALGGKNLPEARRLRTTYSKKLWKILTHVCQGILKKWGKETPPGEAAEYVLRNEHALSRFLKEPTLVPHNNRVERFGRPEKLMLSACKFRDTLSGRVVYDVLSTLVATCCATDVPFFTYAQDILKNRDAVALKPEDWTPRAWSQRQQTIQK